MESGSALMHGHVPSGSVLSAGKGNGDAYFASCRAARNLPQYHADTAAPLRKRSFRVFPVNVKQYLRGMRFPAYSPDSSLSAAAMMEAFNMLHNPDQEPSCPVNRPDQGWGEQADPASFRSPSHSTGATGGEAGRRPYGGHQLLKGAAGRAATDDGRRLSDGNRSGRNAQNRNQADDDIEKILREVDTKRNSQAQDTDSHVTNRSSDGSRVRSHSAPQHVYEEDQPKTARRRQNGSHAGAGYASAVQSRAAADVPPHSGKKKKKRKSYSFVDILKMFVPWRGDTGFEAIRKIIFSTALVVVGVCTFLISNYYIDLYKAKAAYQEIQDRIMEARNNRGFTATPYSEDEGQGGTIEFLELSDVGRELLAINPDAVGYIRIPNTLVSYPVVQKRSNDPNDNKNDYYLYRTFKQEKSKSGCIFMDFRCHFDQVADNRRIVENSDNLLIYGHNMNNQTMFGSLRNYVNNIYYYKEHPVVELQSCYNFYQYKIFAVFVVDGSDYESEYAFNCWNVLDFAGEDDFYDFVNQAKRRTMISTSVDVEYGDPLLTLYTCNGLVKMRS